MTRFSFQQDRWVVSIGLLLAFLLAVNALADLATAILPAQLDDLRWRFGAFGLVTGQLTPLMIAWVLVLAVGVWWDRRWLLRLQAIVGLILLLGLVAGGVNFVLDAVSLRGELAETSRLGYDLAVSRAGGVTAIVALLLLMTTIAAWRAGGGRRAHRRPADAPIVGSRPVKPKETSPNEG